jgi:hypothetical protein
MDGQVKGKGVGKHLHPQHRIQTLPFLANIVERREQ